MGDLVIMDDLQRPGAGFVAGGAQFFHHGRRHVQPARLQHQRHHGEARQ